MPGPEGRMPNVEVQVGQKLTLSNGFVIAVSNPVEEQLPIPGEVENHEAEHAVVGVVDGAFVELVTSIPGPGYKGLTRLDRFDAPAAAAPHSQGRDGTGWDTMVIELSGNDIGNASGTASRILSTRRDEVYRVAARLRQKGTMGHGDVVTAMSEAEEIRSETQEREVDVSIKGMDGGR